MKKRFLTYMTGLALLTGAAGCKKTLDINSDPNAPQYIPAEALLPSVLTQMARGVQYDGAYLGRYIQNWHSTSVGDAFDRHGWSVPAAFEDPAGEIWRMTYFAIGKNLTYILEDAKTKGKWDYAGVASAVRAWSWMTATDYHGEIILNEAFTDGQYRFNYNTQEEVYDEVRRLCFESLAYLNRTDGLVSVANLKKGDIVYQGERTKWIRFVNGLLARYHQHLANKAAYRADSAIYYANLAMGANADDFLVYFTGTSSANANFFGASYTLTTGFDRNRQSRFITQLLDGSTFAGNTQPQSRDPRIKAMLSRSNDSVGVTNGGFRSINVDQGDPNVGFTSGANANKRVAMLWGDFLYARPATGVGKYLFKDDAKFPIMTYAEMQFIKAEAYWKSGDKTSALTAYRAGVTAHLDFVQQFAQAPAQPLSVISATEKTAFLNNATLVKNSTATLRLQDIMLQKYIALWGWGFVETWNDLRRYHYGQDQSEGNPVYLGFTFPAAFYPDNNGQPAYRFRPRWNSEYIWNRPALESIGALNPDYHTYETWITKP